MKLELTRQKMTEKGILGSLTVDGEFECYTIEDEKPIEYIPLGVYSVDVTPSQRFGRPLPLLLRVPGRTAIRIHPGNTDADTVGCILVGNQHTDTELTESRAACDSLTAKIVAAIARKEQVTISLVSSME